MRLCAALPLAALWCGVAAQPAGEEARPRYFKVDSEIETLWQRPSLAGAPKGIFFIAHGCEHQGTDVFADKESDGWRFEECASSNYGRCLGLPEEVQLRQAARARGYIVVAVSGSGMRSCWFPGDEVKVGKALRHVQQAEGLPDDSPVLAMGASSGGGFMWALASLSVKDGGVKNLTCVVSQIMGFPGVPAHKVPTLFVHMSRDARTAESVSASIQELKQASAGFRASEIRVEPRPVTIGLLRRCYGEADAQKVLKALTDGKLLDGSGYLVNDPRERLWPDAVQAAIGLSADTLQPDQSCLSEELNVAYAMHEMTAQYAQEQLDFCQGAEVGSGGMSESIEATEARGHNLHRGASGQAVDSSRPTVSATGPAWTHDSSVERPAGEESKGSYKIAVYTTEQQARLGVDKFGTPPSGQAPAGHGQQAPAAAAHATPLLGSPAPATSPAPEPVTAVASAAPLQQVLVFDAGSSGTRIHVYNLHSGGARVPEVDLSVAEAQTKKVKPGLSTFAESGDLDSAQQSLEQLLAFADQLVPPAHRATTPVMLKATAGLRAVSTAQAEAMVKRVRKTLADSSYLFQNEWAEIITGKEEAGFAWIAANYLQGTFADHHRAWPVGVLELGGGSAQVSFEVGDAASSVADDDLFVFRTADGSEYSIYAHSYLGFGQDHAQKHMQESKLGLTSDPCYPSGYIRGDGAAAVSGQGDARRCQEAIQRAMFSAAGAPGQYSDEQVVRGSFVAIENFFFVLSNLQAPMAENVTALERRAEEVCGAKLAHNPALADARKAGRWPEVGQPKECFALCYQATLLRALKVHSQPGVQFRCLGQIKGSSVEWALGAALVHAMQHTKLARGRKPFPWPAALVACVVLIGVSQLLRPLLFGDKGGARDMQIAPVDHAVRPSKLGRIGVSRKTGYDRVAPAE